MSRTRTLKLHRGEHVTGRRGRGRGRSDRGYVLELTAILLVPLLLMAGFAVDLGGDYARAIRMQRAADAGALAGVVWLPDFAKAQSVALAVVVQDGYTTGGNVTVTVTQVGARRLQVKIVAPEGGFFVSKILNTSYTITRSSTAEYLRPIAMGSPIASLANNPESAAAPPQIWLNQSGAGSNKTNGDQFSAGLCTATGSGWMSGCVDNVNPSQTNANKDLDNNGYNYITRVSSLGTGPLHVQVYDPAFIYTGDKCTVNGYNGGQQTTLINQFTAAGDAKASERYNWSDLDWCPGDQNINGKQNLTTTYIVRAPDLTPLDQTDNPAVCAISFDPYDGSAFGGNLFNKLDQTVLANKANEGLENMPFSAIFRKWVDICTVSSPVVGDYVVQVTTTANQTTPHFSTTGTLTKAGGGAGTLEQRDMSITTGGHNRYAIRAGFGSSIAGSGVGVFGAGRLPIYVNQNSSSATFYLAQLTPDYAGATLVLSFFDIADTAGQANMQVLGPSDSGSNYPNFPNANCVFTRDGGTPNVIPSSNCGINSLTSSNYDGRTVSLKLQIPGDYTCNPAATDGCWVKVKLDFVNGTPADTTTWSASLLGDPVRLVQ